MSTTATLPALAQVWAHRTDRPLLRQIALVVAGIALMTASAKIQVPFWPVPMTMQTYVVLVLGLAYGGGLGLATMLGYLAVGAAGLPVFASGGGLAYFSGPTAGYLIGFAVAAAVLGSLARQGWGRTLGKALLAMILGHVIIFALGVAWLSYLFGLDAALANGLYPFIAGSILKTALAAATLPLAWKLVDRRQ